MPAPHISPYNTRTKISLVLIALLVLVSSLAWMPVAVQASHQAEVGAKPFIDAWISGNRLYVEAQGLPRNRAFVLRARRGSEESWTKLGKVESNRFGILNKDFRLPEKLTRTTRLQVCLKDKKAGRQYCTRAWQID